MESKEEVIFTINQKKKKHNLIKSTKSFPTLDFFINNNHIIYFENSLHNAKMCLP